MDRVRRWVVPRAGAGVKHLAALRAVRAATGVLALALAVQIGGLVLRGGGAAAPDGAPARDGARRPREAAPPKPAFAGRGALGASLVEAPLLPPSGSVFGRVVDETGASLAAVTVALVPILASGPSAGAPGFPEPATTDSEGRFAFARTPPAASILRARKLGYAPNEAAPEPGREVTLVLTRAGAVRGKIVDAAGTPVSGCRLTIRDLDALLGPQDLRAPATTDAVGGFAVGDLPAGRRLAVRAVVLGLPVESDPFVLSPGQTWTCDLTGLTSAPK